MCDSSEIKAVKTVKSEICKPIVITKNAKENSTPAIPLPSNNTSVRCTIFLFNDLVANEKSLQITDRVATFLANEGRLQELSVDVANKYWDVDMRELYKASVEKDDDEEDDGDVEFDIWVYSKPLAKQTKTELQKSGRRFTRMLNKAKGFQPSSTADYPLLSLAEVVQDVGDGLKFIVLSQRTRRIFPKIKIEVEKKEDFVVVGGAKTTTSTVEEQAATGVDEQEVTTDTSSPFHFSMTNLS